MSMLGRILYFAAPIVLLTAAALGQEDAGHTEWVPDVIEEFDIAKDGDLIIVPVALEGRKYPFLVAIGSPTVVDSRLRSVMKGPSTRRDEDSPEEFGPQPMRLGKSEFEAGPRVKCVDTTAFREMAGHEFYGALGQDFFRGRTVQIDFDRGKFRLLRGPLESTPDGTELEPLWDQKERGYPCVDWWVGGHFHSFLIDTGCIVSVMMSNPLLGELVNQGEVEIVGRDGLLNEGRRSLTRRGIIKTGAPLGDIVSHNIRVVEGPRDVIGLSYLSRFMVILDFDGGFMYLAPGARFAEPEPDGCGVDFMLREGEVRVTAVAKASLGKGAGIRVGDVISEVNGTPAGEWTLFRIRRILSRPAPVHLVVRRKNETVPVVLRRSSAPKDEDSPPCTEATNAALPRTPPPTRR